MLADEGKKELAALNDRSLVSLYRSGDQGAFRQLAARYFFVIRHKAAEFYGRGVEPDDLFQEGLLGLHYAAISFDEKNGAFSAYAGVCVRNRMISAIRSFGALKKRIDREHCSIEEVQSLVSDPLCEPENAVISREAMESLLSYLRDNLSDKELSVLSLYVDGKSYDEISCQLGISKKSCDNAMQRVRKKLRIRN